MVTVVTKSIGTGGGRDYTSPQAWEDASPADLVTADQVWKGENYNDSEYGGTAPVLNISGQTTDATRYMWFTTAAGHSFRDHASVQTNPLCYDQTKGVGIKCDALSRDSVVLIQTSYTLFENIQVTDTGSGYAGNWPITVKSTAANCTLKNCIFEDVDTAYNGFVVFDEFGENNLLLINCLIKAHVHSGVGGSSGLVGLGTGLAINCTIVLTGTHNGAGQAVGGKTYDGGMGDFINCAFFGFYEVTAATHGSFTTCMTDLGSAPSGVALSKTYANQFENITNGTHDFRVKSGADLIGAGTTDSRASPDIAKTTRPSGSGYDIGAWEFVSGGATTVTGAGSAAGTGDALAVGDWLIARKVQPVIVRQAIHRAASW